jgi:hypothetical protein
MIYASAVAKDMNEPVDENSVPGSYSKEPKPFASKQVVQGFT